MFQYRRTELVRETDKRFPCKDLYKTRRKESPLSNTCTGFILSERGVFGQEGGRKRVQSRGGGKSFKIQPIMVVIIGSKFYLEQ